MDNLPSVEDCKTNVLLFLETRNGGNRKHVEGLKEELHTQLTPEETQPSTVSVARHFLAFCGGCFSCLMKMQEQLCSVALSLEPREILQSLTGIKVLCWLRLFFGFFVLKYKLYLHLTGNQWNKLTYDSDKAQAILSTSDRLEALDIICTQTSPWTQLLEVPR